MEEEGGANPKNLWTLSEMIRKDERRFVKVISAVSSGHYAKMNEDFMN